MAQWAKFPWKDALFVNADESILRQAPAAAENLYANEAGGYSRFPGLKSSVSLPNTGRNYVFSWRQNLISITESGKVYRIAQNGAAEDVTGTPVSGGRRPVIAATEDELAIAAGGPIIRLASRRTEQLADNAPPSTHIAYIDGYLIAIEPYSGRFWYSDPGVSRVWNDLSVFTAEAKPDDLTAVVVTPYRELLLAGPDSIEQWERLANGDKPFYRRWSTGEGLAYPYTLVADVSGNWGVNGKTEFVSFQSQVSRPQSDDIAMSLEAIDDWTDAWASALAIGGQRYILLQAPFASNYYGTKGATFILDYRKKRWSMLYGWDADAGAPTRWPGWSIAPLWNRVFVGVEDGIAELDRKVSGNLGHEARALIRSAHVSDFGSSRVDNVRVRLKRGLGAYTGPRPQIGLRMIRDGGNPTTWVWRDLGRPGEIEMTLHFGAMGCAYTWQMEIALTDQVAFEFVEASIQVERLRW